MVLQVIKDNQSWIQMQWKCSFPMGWYKILHTAHAMSSTFKEPEVLIGNPGTGSQRIDSSDRPEEKQMLVLRGYSNILRGKISIVFYTNTDDVIINIPKSLSLPMDYESLSKGVGPMMDSIELRLYSA